MLSYKSLLQIVIFTELTRRANPKTPHPLYDDEEASVLTSDFDAKRWDQFSFPSNLNLMLMNEN